MFLHSHSSQSPDIFPRLPLRNYNFDNWMKITTYAIEDPSSSILSSASFNNKTIESYDTNENRWRNQILMAVGLLHLNYEGNI